MEKKKMSLPVQIVLALILGIVVGLIFYFIGKPEITTNYFKPFGTIFVNLLKFIVVPVVGRRDEREFHGYAGRYLPEQHVEVLYRREHAAGYRDRADVRRRHPCCW